MLGVVLANTLLALPNLIKRFYSVKTEIYNLLYVSKQGFLNQSILLKNHAFW